MSMRSVRVQAPQDFPEPFLRRSEIVPDERSEGAPSRCGPKKHRLTKTQERLLRYIAGETALHGGVCCSKQDLADMLGRNVKTVDRCISTLRREGFIETVMRFDERGAQISSEYRLVRGSAP